MKKYLILFSSILFIPAFLQAQVNIGRMLTENRVNPYGIDIAKPRFTWQFESGKRNVVQTAYELKVTSGKSTVWSTGRVNSSQSVQVMYNGQALKSGTRYTWQVRSWDNDGKVSPWSKPAVFQMAFLDPSDWKAKWIQPGYEEKENERPSPLMRKEFNLSKKNIASATAYITSHGMYVASINGQRVGDAYLTPGWTAYKTKLQYQAYDVTAMLRQGRNAIGIMLGNGWYRGIIGYMNNVNVYGKDISLLCQLDIVFKDGSKESVISDGSWKCSTGEVVYSEIYNGETIDNRLEKTGWTNPGFKDSGWSPVREASFPQIKLMATINEPVRKHETFVPLKVIKTPSGDTVLDYGQNLVGWVVLKVTGKSGDKIVLSHAEALDKDGDFYIDNLRHAKAQDVYILKGGAEEVFEPHFTWHGFRYLKIQGYPGEIKPENFIAVALYSDMETTGTFITSNTLINQLQHNIQWGQKGNFLDVPTDCPQRDERLGWTGDAQVFSRTAAFNMNVNSFFDKWLGDLAADQMEGAVPYVVPNVLGNSGNSAGWADAATIIPWNMYLVYGDKGLLEQQYPSMKAYVESIRKIARNDLWNTGFHFGDWLFYRPEDDNDGRSAVTDKYLIAQCFYARSTEILVKSAELLGKKEDADFYSSLLQRIKDAFVREYMTASGRLVSGTQTAYVLALNFDMLPENFREQAAARLAENIQAYNLHLTTGFLGTPYLCHVLSRFGYNDLAYKLLLQEDYPSWLYPVKMGATTIWERWDGIKPNGTFQTPSMNSLNHYAYGAIGDWMYRVMAGIDTYEGEPGYRHSIIKPRIGGGFTTASAGFESYYGRLSSAWKVEDDRMVFDIEIPPNTTSDIFIPALDMDDVALDDNPVEQAQDLKIRGLEEGYLVMQVGSGKWHFTAKKTIAGVKPDYTDYIGKYKVEGGMTDIIEVSVEGKKLILTMNSNKYELFPVKGENDRFTDADSHIVTFQRDQDGIVYLIRLEAAGTAMEGNRQLE